MEYPVRIEFIANGLLLNLLTACVCVSVLELKCELSTASSNINGLILLPFSEFETEITAIDDMKLYTGIESHDIRNGDINLYRH